MSPTQFYRATMIFCLTIPNSIELNMQPLILYVICSIFNYKIGVPPHLIPRGIVRRLFGSQTTQNRVFGLFLSKQGSKRTCLCQHVSFWRSTGSTSPMVLPDKHSLKTQRPGSELAWLCMAWLPRYLRSCSPSSFLNG